MNYESTTDANGRESPKRRRLDTPDSATNDAVENSNGELPPNYAYEVEDDENTFHTPQDDLEQEVNVQSLRIEERPLRLNYVLHKTLHGHTSGVAQVKYSPDGQWIASCSADATIKIWSAQSGELVQTLEGHLAGVSTISWSPDSKVLASGSDDKLIRLWNVNSGKCLSQPLVGHHNYIYSIAFSPKGNMIVSGSYDEAVFLWMCGQRGQCLKTLVHEDNAQVTSVRFSPNGRFVLAATLDSSVRLWDYVDGRCVKTYQEGEDTDQSDHDARVWAFIACGSEDGKIFLWDVSSKEIMQEVNAHNGVVLGVDISSTTQELVTCGVDSTIKIWKRRPLDAGEEVVTNGHAVNGIPDTPAKPDIESPAPLIEESG
ncbi:hypothetical protein MRB53_039928 [Persea americana]|nr:hypothetical protein MRB53_039928 [Persea americana]